MDKGILAARNRYDLTHYTFMVGNINQLQTLSVIPVVAGDSMKLDFVSVFRLSPLRKNLTLDVEVELFLFYHPYRRVYGNSNWPLFITGGWDESISLTTRTLTGATQIFGCHTSAGQTVPEWMTFSYINIYNRYFKHPSDADFAVSYFDAIADGDTRLQHGLQTGFKRRVWNSQVTATTGTPDYRFALTDGNTTVDLINQAAAKGQFKSERRREFYANRYNEIMQAQFGATQHEDVENIPELIYHQKCFVGGNDIMGTDDATLGKYTGVAKSVCAMSVPKRFFNEHGTLWLMCLPRFEPVINLENHYLSMTARANPSYAELAGDPELFKTKGPVTLNIADYILGSSLTDAGIVPYGQWYREQPHRVHSIYQTVTGFPFVNQTFSSVTDIKYVPLSAWQPMFQSTELAQWQIYGKVNLVADRVIPEVSTSVFAGTN